MTKLIQPRLEIERKRAVEQARKDSIEAAITQVKTKLKEQMEAEQAAKEAAEGRLMLDIFIYIYKQILTKGARNHELEMTLINTSLSFCHMVVKENEILVYSFS